MYDKTDNRNYNISQIIIFQQVFLIKTNFSVIIIYNKKNVVFPNISDFDDLYTKSLEEFSIEEKPDNLLSLYSYIKNAKMTYRVPISNKLIGFRLRSLNRFVYKINKLIYFILSELHYFELFQN